eukprot:Hpha_TRINITY_DN16462_c5_g4::TRINITY_DN16462_c5_g4_i1::g.161926::m.161926/K07359/CAMKK2; calcium/calmodulin-dependent protein kinase kinase 2
MTAAGDEVSPDLKNVHPLVRRLPQDRQKQVLAAAELLLSYGLTAGDDFASVTAALQDSESSAALPEKLRTVEAAAREHVVSALQELVSAGLTAADLVTFSRSSADGSPKAAPAPAPEEVAEDAGGPTEYHDDEDKAFEGEYEIADCTLCADMIASGSFEEHWANGKAPPGKSRGKSKPVNLRPAPQVVGQVLTSPLNVRSPGLCRRSSDSHGGLGVSQSNSHVRDTSTVQKGTDAAGNKTINEYAVLRDLGRGAYGKVKMVVHLETGTHAAIKILNKSMLAKVKKGGGGDLGSAQSALDDVLREVAIMKRLNHPNIIRLFEVIDDPECDKMYIIMDLATNGCIFRLGEQDPLPTDRIRHLATGICQGLDYLHLHGIVHRDIKPENILLDVDNEPRLTDFGVSQVVEGTEEVEDTQGTPAFLTPEQICVQKIPGFMTDLWALGVTLYILCFGKLPFIGGNMQELSAQIRDEEPPYEGCSDDMCVSLMKGLLCKELTQRLGNNEGVRDVLRHTFLASEPEAALQEYKINTKVTDEDKEAAVLTGYNIKLNFANAVGVMMKVKGAAQGFRGALSKGQSVGQYPRDEPTLPLPDLPTPSPDVQVSVSVSPAGSALNSRNLTSVERALGGAALDGDGHALEEGSSDDDDDEPLPRGSGRNLTKSQIPKNTAHTYKKQWFTFSRHRSFRTEDQVMRDDGQHTDVQAAIQDVRANEHTDILLSGHRFDCLPETLFECNTLVNLISSRNGLLEVSPRISNLASLKTLVLSHNQIQYLPSAIGELKFLAQLNLGNNKLVEVPESLGGLQGLKILNLDYNKLSKIPDCIGNIRGLQKCFLVANTGLLGFPKSLKGLEDCTMAVTNSERLTRSWAEMGSQLPNVKVLWDKIYPDAVTDHVFLGSLRTTQNESVLKELGITRILTTGKGLKVIDPLPQGIQQLIISVDDNPDQKLVPFFDQCTEWLDQCVEQDRRVLVHCFMGLSRSVTVVCAWLMKRRRMTFKEAITFIKKGRPAVNPNAGFRRQLIEYEEVLYGTRLAPDDIENHCNGPTVDKEPSSSPTNSPNTPTQASPSQDYSECRDH